MYDMCLIDKISGLDLSSLVNFKKVISNQSCYGLIWEGTYSKVSDESVAIKMVMLKSGDHYDHISQVYYNLLGQTKEPPESFQTDNDAPFLHTEFKTKRSMDHNKFIKEIQNLQELSSSQSTIDGFVPTGQEPGAQRSGPIPTVQEPGAQRSGPRFYGAYIVAEYPIHYGFIIMERTDCSLKDILLTRSLTSAEDQIIKIAIDKLHQNYVHGDMKPSNIGVFLDSKTKIINKVYFLDCGKLRNKRDFLTPNAFSLKVAADWRIYHKHKLQNIQQGKQIDNNK
jgi:serine/threonine protein kinase